MASRCQALSWCIVVTLAGFFSAYATYNMISCNIPVKHVHNLHRTNDSLFTIEYFVQNQLQICVINAQNITDRTKFYYRLTSISECCITKQGSLTLAVALYIMAILLCAFIMLSFCSRCCLFSPNNQEHARRITPFSTNTPTPQQIEYEASAINTHNTNDIPISETSLVTVKNPSTLGIGRQRDTNHIIVVINPE